MSNQSFTEDSIPELEPYQPQSESPPASPSPSPRLLVLPSLPSFSPLRLESSPDFFYKQHHSPKETKWGASNQVSESSFDLSQHRFRHQLSLPVPSPSSNSNPAPPKNSGFLNTPLASSHLANEHVSNESTSLTYAQPLHNSFITESGLDSISISQQNEDDDNQSRISAFAFNQTVPPVSPPRLRSRRLKSNSVGNLSSFNCLRFANLCQANDFGPGAMDDCLSVPDLKRRGIRDSLNGLQSLKRRDPFELQAFNSLVGERQGSAEMATPKSTSLGVYPDTGVHPQDHPSIRSFTRMRKSSGRDRSESVRSDNDSILTLGPGSRSSQTKSGKKRDSTPSPRMEIVGRLHPVKNRDEEYLQPQVGFARQSSTFEDRIQIIPHPFNSEARKIENRRVFKSDDEIDDERTRAEATALGLIFSKKDSGFMEPRQGQVLRKERTESVGKRDGNPRSVSRSSSPIALQVISAPSTSVETSNWSVEELDLQLVPAEGGSRNHESLDPAHAFGSNPSIFDGPSKSSKLFSRRTEDLSMDPDTGFKSVTKHPSDESLNEDSTFLPSVWSSPQIDETKVRADDETEELDQDELPSSLSQQTKRGSPRFKIQRSPQRTIHREAEVASKRDRLLPRSSVNSASLEPQRNRPRPALSQLQPPPESALTFKDSARPQSSGSFQGSTLLTSTWASSELLNDSLKSTVNSRSSSHNMSRTKNSLRKSDSLPSLSSLNQTLSKFESESKIGAAVIAGSENEVGEAKRRQISNVGVFMGGNGKMNQEKVAKTNELASIEDEEPAEENDGPTLEELLEQFNFPRRATSLSITHCSSNLPFFRNEARSWNARRDKSNQNFSGRQESVNPVLSRPIQVKSGPQIGSVDAAPIPKISHQEILPATLGQLNPELVNVDSSGARSGQNRAGSSAIHHSRAKEKITQDSSRVNELSDPNQVQDPENRRKERRGSRSSSPIPFSIPFEKSFFRGSDLGSDHHRMRSFSSSVEGCQVQLGHARADSGERNVFQGDDSGVASSQRNVDAAENFRPVEVSTAFKSNFEGELDESQEVVEVLPGDEVGSGSGVDGEPEVVVVSLGFAY